MMADPATHAKGSHIRSRIGIPTGEREDEKSATVRFHGIGFVFALVWLSRAWVSARNWKGCRRLGGGVFIGLGLGLGLGLGAGWR